MAGFYTGSFNHHRCLQANGSVLVHQKMFESRLFFVVDKLIEMGAQIILCDPHH